MLLHKSLSFLNLFDYRWAIIIQLCRGFIIQWEEYKEHLWSLHFFLSYLGFLVSGELLSGLFFRHLEKQHKNLQDQPKLKLGFVLLVQVSKPAICSSNCNPCRPWSLRSRISSCKQHIYSLYYDSYSCLTTERFLIQFCICLVVGWMRWNWASWVDSTSFLFPGESISQ